MAKDNEIKAAQASAQELQKRLDVATAELADASRLAPAPAPAPQGDICALAASLEACVSSCSHEGARGQAETMLP